MRIRTALVALTAGAALTVTACTPPNENPSPETPGTTDSADTTDVEENAAAEDPTEATDATGTSDAAEDTVTLVDGVVREKGADSEMTAVFGELHNPTGADIAITGFTTSLGAPVNELHEVVDGVMQEMESELVIPAGESHLLEPGGDHLMIMGYPEPIPAGDEVAVTLELGDGSTVEFPGVPVRTIAAGEENYGADGELTGHDAHAGH